MSFRRLVPWIVPALVLALVLLKLQAQTDGDAEKPKAAKQAEAGGKKAAKKKKNKAGQRAAALPATAPSASLNRPEVHEDFPVMCLTADGKPVVVFIENDGDADSLMLAGLDADGGLEPRGFIAEPEAGNIYQPCLTRVQDGRILCVWSQLEQDGRWDLMSRFIEADGAGPDGEAQRLTESSANDIFADLGTDRHGRVWLTWQRLEKGISNVYAMHTGPETRAWSEEIAVTAAQAGDWEPRLAFGAGEDALIVFDSYRNGNFDVFLARVSPSGGVSDPIAVADSSRYEARAEAAASPDGKSLWVVYEDGMELWGKDLGADWRKKGGGLHHDRQIKVVKVDLASGTVEKIADITSLLPDLVSDATEVGTGAIDVPEIIVDGDGRPWVFFRYCLFSSKGFWQTAFSRLDETSGEWTRPELLGNSSFCLDRRTSVALHPGDGSLKAVYASDSRTNKQAGDSGIFLASIDPRADRGTVAPMPFDLMKKRPTELKPYNDTPERERDDHHSWNFGGENYTLYWGDVHRHTDFSNCRTTDDGCIVEHFRYAIEAGGLDYLGTSDHTEVGKRYTDYEWWQTQKLADLFHNPHSFVSMYAYEREQKFPYGHRNVLFLERGGPLIYIKRKNYEESRWATPLPKPDGDILGDIPPWQLWDLLDVHGRRAITIEHTSAGGMGTDWSKYREIDTKYENILEVFQGSRQSFEGEGAPQPPIVVGGPQVSRFSGNSATGTWQKALALEHRLGAFASSDHRSVNISYGGVYVKKGDFDREGVFDAMDARRTCAATDKIYMEFSCNGHMMGEEFVADSKPEFTIRIEGTAAIDKVTLVRNEEDYQVFSPQSLSASFKKTFVEEQVPAGEYRYYLRIEQVDGNMGWTSPVWVTVK